MFSILIAYLQNGVKHHVIDLAFCNEINDNFLVIFNAMFSVYYLQFFDIQFLKLNRIQIINGMKIIEIFLNVHFDTFFEFIVIYLINVRLEKEN